MASNRRSSQSTRSGDYPDRVWMTVSVMCGFRPIVAKRVAFVWSGRSGPPTTRRLTLINSKNEFFNAEATEFTSSSGGVHFPQPPKRLEAVMDWKV